MRLSRAALLPALLLVAGGCGSSGTSEVAEPAAVVGSQAVVTPTPTPTPKAVTTTAAKPKPVTTKKTVVEFKVIPFKTKTVTDSSVPKGEKSVTTQGVNGTRRLTYEVTIVDGRQTAKELIKQEVVKQPRTQVTTVGTKVEEAQESGCDPNYSGGCVPIASDVDCSGGSGNGPEYVRGPVTVVGDDVYDLDRDSDGLGCED
ncbi:MULTISPECIES: G5 domain-containing protein [unclassified Kribbella]|uniref:G5 domain-containing protein n=1 Tax=unclassified Kribbella TaxID=2644121 RepID=UPI0033CDEE4E